MVTKADIKKLLSKGLTGREAARLILQDSWEVDHDRQGFLSEGDIQRIKQSLAGQEADEYNKWVRVYQLVDYTIKDAHIHALRAQNVLLVAIRMLEVYYLEDRIRHIQLFMPAIVTEKQYQELQAKQKESKLKGIHTLRDVLDSKAQEIASQALLDEWQEGDEDGIYDFFFDFLAEKYLAKGQEQYVEPFRQAVQDIILLIQEGKLRPAQIQPDQVEALKALEQKLQERRDRHRQEEEQMEDEEQRLEALISPDAEFDTTWKDKEALMEASYQASKSQISQESLASLISSLEGLKTLSLEEEETGRLLDYTCCSVEELYQAGLAEWIKWIDTYDPSWDEATAARPAGMMQSWTFAILQNPEPQDLDERGYYKEHNLLGSLSGYNRKTTAGVIDPDFLLTAHRHASEHVKILLAIQAVVEAVSQVIGVDFTEDLEDWYSTTEDTITLYNLRASPDLSPEEAKYNGPPYYLGMPKLKALKIGRLKPTAKSLKYYRERMALALGGDWWKEAIDSLDFQEPDKDSLAGQFLRELRQIKKAREEGLGKDEILKMLKEEGRDG